LAGRKQEGPVIARAIVALTNPLLPRLKTQDVARQLRRAALSTASNYRAACRAKSHRDFTSKIATVLEEADEAQGWLETLKDCGLVDARTLVPHLKEAEELVKIFTASHRTSRGNDDRPRDRP
jgi:four helix bundle protein